MTRPTSAVIVPTIATTEPTGCSRAVAIGNAVPGVAASAVGLAVDVWVGAALPGVGLEVCVGVGVLVGVVVGEAVLVGVTVGAGVGTAVGVSVPAAGVLVTGVFVMAGEGSSEATAVGSGLDP